MRFWVSRLTDSQSMAGYLPTCRKKSAVCLDRLRPLKITINLTWHIFFGGPSPYRKDVIERLRTENEELTPDLLVDTDFFTDPDCIEDYQNVPWMI